jgi:hypothetical protein
MGKDAALLLIFAAFFGAPIAIAVLLALLSRWLHAARRVAARPQPADAMAMIEYGRRRVRCFRAAATGLLAGAAALSVFELPMTAMALLAGGILHGLVVHLRCPSCDTTAGPQGVAVRGHCFRCGARLA